MSFKFYAPNMGIDLYFETWPTAKDVYNALEHIPFVKNELIKSEFMKHAENAEVWNTPITTAEYNYTPLYFYYDNIYLTVTPITINLNNPA